MAVLVDVTTRVLVQGITGSFGARHTRLSIQCGTNIVAGVTPGKGGELFDGRIPIYDTVAEAVTETGAQASVIFVPAPSAPDAIMEAVDAGLETIVCITEGIPVIEMLKISSVLSGMKTRLIGPNSPGIMTPGQIAGTGCRLGVAPPHIFRRGHIGVVSRSGSLTYEAVWQLTRVGLGQSTCIGIGGDPIHGLSLLDAVRLFMEDPETHAIVMIGEIGGSEEEEVAEWLALYGSKPLVAYIAGRGAPPERRMGHAGAIIMRGDGAAQRKIDALRKAGVVVVESITQIGLAIGNVLRAMA